MKLYEFLERYVFVRKCVSCGELLGYEERAEAFCPACRIKFERAKTDFCSKCGKAMVECSCMPDRCSRAGLITLRRLVEYRPEKQAEPSQKLIYFMKRNRNRRVASFIADQLSFWTGELISELDVESSDVVISIVPRSRASVVKYGFDQSELIATELAGMLGVEYLPIIKRSGKRVKKQKRLRRRQRVANVKGSFEIDNELFGRLNGRAVILFDDVVTSGASMAEASRLLHKHGVKTVVGMCIASTHLSCYLS